MTVFFITELRKYSSKDGMSHGSLVDYESEKIKRTVLSRTVADLYSFMTCFGSCEFISGLWMDLLGEVADNHMSTDAKNWVTTARTIHLLEQKRNNAHDFHVAKGSLFRKYSWACSNFNSELFGKVIGEGRHFDHSSENRETIGTWRSSKRLHGVELSCTQRRNVVFLMASWFFPQKIHEKDHPM